MSRFVYYPFVVLFIMLAGRSSLFDGYDWPLSLIGIYLITCLILVFTAIALQRVAKQIQANALKSLKRLESEKKKKTDGSKKLESIIKEIEAVKDGVFASPMNNPILRAALIPVGGISAIHIMESLSTFA